MVEEFQKLNRSLDEVLDYYENQGFFLSQKPNLVMFGDYHPLSPNSLMSVDNDVFASLKIMELFNQNFSKLIYKETYNVELSDDAIDEITYLTNLSLNEFVSNPLQTETNTIYIYDAALNNIENETFLKRVFAHEVWHLIEKSEDIFYSAPFITEGTATYAMNMFQNKFSDRQLKSGLSFNEIMYEGCANLVQSYVCQEYYPLKSLLDVDLRLLIQSDLINKIKPMLVDAATKSLQEINICEFINNSSIYSGEVTSDSIIDAYEKMGAYVTADELRSQDLSMMVEEFQKYS